MSPFESELLQSAWPVLSSIMGTVAVWYLKNLARTLEKMQDHLSFVEKEIKDDLAEFKIQSQHKIDTIIGSTNARLGQVETVCEMQYGVQFKRRSTDMAGWAQTSDVSGKRSQ